MAEQVGRPDGLRLRGHALYVVLALAGAWGWTAITQGMNLVSTLILTALCVTAVLVLALYIEYRTRGKESGPWFPFSPNGHKKKEPLYRGSSKESE